MTNMNMIKAEQGKPCLIDYNGNICLNPRITVDTLSYPTNGLAVVGKNGKYGYINESGRLVIPMTFKKAYPFAENGLAFVVCENGLGGYINKEGKFVINPIYETGSLFRFGLAAVSSNGEYIYIYKNGSKAINHTFKYATALSHCGLAKVVGFDGQHSLMDTASLEVLKLKPGSTLEAFKDGTRVTKFSRNGKEALISAAGEIITGYYEKIIIYPYSRLHPFLRNGLWGYLDNRGKEVIPNIYKEASWFEEFKQYDVAAVKSYHPLAENNVVNLYINKKDEIIDSDEIEASKQHLHEKFSKVNRFHAQRALAVIKETNEKEKTYIQGGVKNMNEEQQNNYNENEQESINELTNDKHNEKTDDNHYDFTDDAQLQKTNDDRVNAENEEKTPNQYVKKDEEDDEEANTNNDDSSESEEDEKYYEQFTTEDGRGWLYEVDIYFRNMPIRDEIYEFLMENLEGGIMIVDIKVNYARLLWPIDEMMDEGDIENAMYYILDDYRLGQYTTRIYDTYYATTSGK